MNHKVKITCSVFTEDFEDYYQTFSSEELIVYLGQHPDFCLYWDEEVSEFILLQIKS